MAGLKFLITGDDTPLRQLLKKLEDDEVATKKRGEQLSNQIIDSEKRQRQQAIDLVNKQTEAIRNRNSEEAKRPVSMPATPADAPATVNTFVNTPSKADLIAQYKDVDAAINKISSDYAAGTIPLTQYEASVSALSAKQNELKAAIRGYEVTQVQATATTAAATEATAASGVTVQKQTGLIAMLKEEAKKMEAQRERLISGEVAETDKLAVLNQRIAENQEQLRRMRNIGLAGFDDMGNKIDGVTGKIQRLNAISKQYTTMAASSNDVQQIQVFNSKAEQAANEAKRLGNIGREGFDEMGNAIKGSTNWLGKMWGALRKVAYVLPGIGIAGLIGLLIDPLVDYISGLDLFKKKLDQLVETRKMMNEVIGEGSKGAVTEITHLKTLRQVAEDTSISLKKRNAAVYDLKTKYPAYFSDLSNEQILTGKASDAYDRLTKSIEATARARAAEKKIEDISSRIIDDETKMRDLQAQRADLIKKNNDYLDKNAKALNDTYTANQKNWKLDGQRLENEKKRFLTSKQIRDLDNQIRNSATDRQIGNSRIDQLRGYIGGQVKKGANVTTDQTKAQISEENKYQVALAKRQGILNDIAKIQDEFNTKELSQEDAGRKAIVDRFAELRRQLIAYNKWAENYNKNSKNGKKIDTIDIAQLEPIQKQGIEQYDAKIAVDKAKVEADQMKQIYSQYEDYRTEYGKAAADKRFENELKGYTSYVDYIEEKIKEVEGKNDALSNAQRDFWAKELPKAQLDANQKTLDRQMSMLKRALDASKTLASERQRIDKEYAENVSAIEADASATDKENRLRVLHELYDKQIEGLKQLQFEGSEAGKALAFDLFNATRKEIETQIEKIRGLLKTADLTPEQRKALEGFLNNLKQADADANKFYRIAGKIAEAAVEISGALEQLGDSVGGQAGFLIGQTGGLVGVAGNIAGAISSFKTDPVGAITKTIGAAASLFSIGKKVKEMNAAARAEVKKYYDDAAAGELEYQSLLRERARQEAQDTANRLSGLQSEYKLLKQQQGEINQQAADLMTALSGEQYVSSETYKHGTWFRKAKVTQNMASLAGMSYDQIETLYYQGKLTDNAKSLFEELKKLKDEGADVNDALSDLNEQVKEIFTGTSVDSLSDAITQLFADGKTSAADFADFFKSTMSNAAISIFKNNVLVDMLQGWYDDFAAKAESDNQLTDSEVTDLQGSLSVIWGNAQKRWDELQKVMGMDLTTSSGSASGITASLQSLSENTGSAIEGILRGQYDINKQNLLATTEATGILRQQMDIGMQKLRQLEFIQVNTGATAANTAAALPILTASVDRLDKIVAGIKPTMVSK